MFGINSDLQDLHAFFPRPMDSTINCSTPTADGNQGGAPVR